LQVIDPARLVEGFFARVGWQGEAGQAEGAFGQGFGVGCHIGIHARVHRWCPVSGGGGSFDRICAFENRVTRRGRGRFTESEDGALKNADCGGKERKGFAL
jgi:hypothetical protein